MRVPATPALGQHTSDPVVHAWDVARATGDTDELDPELAEAALVWGCENLEPAFRGQALGPDVPVPENALVYDRLAAHARLALSKALQ